MKANKSTTSRQVKNAVKWLEALKGNSGFKKTVSQLGKLPNDEDDIYDPDWNVKDIKKDMRYCCLGVACRVMKYKDVEFSNEVHGVLPDDIGLFDEYGTFKKMPEGAGDEILEADETPIKYENFTVKGLTDLNDEVFLSDTNFKNVRNFIMNNLEYVFIPSVAKGLKEHFKTKK